MAFSVRHLSVLAYANGFTLWHYKALKDTLVVATANNFFGDGADMLTAGDLIMITAIDGARIVSVAIADIETVVVAPLS